jgi:3-hydroxyisobutyrate/3-hydroxypropionate dehydrogenase
MSQATPNGITPHDGVPNCTYGFIGVGVMGNGMAKNLRSKMPPSSKLLICEVNKARRDEFFATTEGLLEVAESPKELAEKAVSALPSAPNVLMR